MNTATEQFADEAKAELEKVRVLVSQFNAAVTVAGAVHSDWDAENALAVAETFYSGGDYYSALRQANQIKVRLAWLNNSEHIDNVIRGMYAFAGRLRGE